MGDLYVRFYDVAKCGYYPWAADSEPRFGDVAFLLSELKGWGVGKTLEQTRLPTPKGTFPTYLFDIVAHKNCWLVVLWNEVPTEDGAVISVSAKAKVGKAKLIDNPIEAGSIPGFPTYFAIFPDQELIATLRLPDRVNGLPGFKGFLSTFLETATSVVVVDDSDPSEPEVLGYTDPEQSEVTRAVHPRFQLQLRRSGIQSDKIIQNAERIRKVIRVREMDIAAASDRAFFQKMLDFTGLTAKPRDQTVRLKYELEVEATRKDIATFVREVEDDVEPQVNDVGFVFDRETDTHWLSNAIPHFVLQVSTQRTDGLYDPDDLAKEIFSNKGKLLAAART